MSIDFIGVGAVLRVISDKQNRRLASALDADNAQELENILASAKDAQELAKAFLASVEQPLRMPPQLGERILLLIFSTKEERINILGDLAEEFSEIAKKHGERFAKVWYYKQVAASAWPMLCKAIRWGVLAWVEEWVRRRV